MNEKKESLVVKVRIQSELVRTLRSALQAIPLGLGSALDIQIFDRIAERERERLEEFVYSLAEDVAQLAVQSSHLIKKDFFDSDEFRFIIREVLLRAAKEHRKEKIAAFRAILLGAMVHDPRIQFDRKVFFLEVVDALSTEHLHLLHFLYKESVSPVKDMWKAFGADDEAAQNYLYSGLDTLANRMLILNEQIPLKKKRAKFPQTRNKRRRDTGRDFRIIDRAIQEFRITKLGIEFIEAVTSPLFDLPHHEH